MSNLPLDRLIAISKANGYLDLKETEESGLVAIMPLMFTHAIISGINAYGYEDRWCYSSYAKAKSALDAWDGKGEPTGWHRHPGTGRRVDADGKEHIMF